MHRLWINAKRWAGPNIKKRYNPKDVIRSKWSITVQINVRSKDNVKEVLVEFGEVAKEVDLKREDSNHDKNKKGNANHAMF